MTLSPTFAEQRIIESVAYGKVILFGEHSVVYGYPALAGVLPNYALCLRLEAKSGFLVQEGALGGHRAAACTESSQNAASLSLRQNSALPLQISAHGAAQPIAEPVARELHMALECALIAVGAPFTLADLASHYVLKIRSQIPFGAGMGGSAALSAALVRLILKLLDKEVSHEQLAFWANQVDTIFHGKASGLDVTAVASDGWIWFKKGKATEELQPGVKCQLLLVDSCQRTPTKDMVNLVKQQWEANPHIIQPVLENLGQVAQSARDFFLAGNLTELGEQMNLAQFYLQKLGVSTPIVDGICEQLLQAGAIGAKLTGAGGGGLVLAAFPYDQQVNLSGLKSPYPLYWGSIG